MGHVGARITSLTEWSDDGEEGADLQDAATDPRVLEVIGQVSDRIIGEISKTFDFYQAQAMREQLRCRVPGRRRSAHNGSGRTSAVTASGWPVEIFDPLRRVHIPEGMFDPEYNPRQRVPSRQWLWGWRCAG